MDGLTGLGTEGVLAIALYTLIRDFAVPAYRKALGKNGKDKGYKYNPHPPGEAAKCEEHSVAIGKIETELGNIKERLDRIEGKLNGRK